MKSLLIIGAGGYGHLLMELAAKDGYDRIAFLDDNSEEAIGKLEEVGRFLDYEDAIIAIGNPDIRGQIYQLATKTHHMISLIHEKAVISPSAQIGEGVVIEPNAIIGTNAVIGIGTYINAGAVVGHDASVGDFCQIDCNSVVATEAVVPDKTKVKSCTYYCC